MLQGSYLSLPRFNLLREVITCANEGWEEGDEVRELAVASLQPQVTVEIKQFAESVPALDRIPQTEVRLFRVDTQG